MASLIITARLLGASGRGTFVAVITWAGTFTTLSSVSINRVVLHRGANETGVDWVAETAGSVALIIAGGTLVSLIVGLALYVGTDGSLFGSVPSEFLLMGTLLLPFAVWDSLGGAFLVATGNLGVLNRARIIGAATQLVAIGALVWAAGLGIAGAIAATLASKMMTSGIVYARLRQVNPARWTWSWAQVRSLLGKGAQLHANTVGNDVRAKVDILMLTYYLHPAAVGIYQMGSRFVAMLLIVPGAAAQSLWQEMGRSSPDAVWPAQKRLIFHMLGLLLVLSSIGYGLAPYAIPWVAGAEFSESADVFRVLLPILIGNSMGGILAPQIVARGWFWQASAAGLTVAAGNIAMNYILIPRYGVSGAVGATLLTYGVVPVIATLIWGTIIERRVRDASRAGDTNRVDTPAAAD